MCDWIFIGLFFISCFIAFCIAFTGGEDERKLEEYYRERDDKE